MGYSTQFGDSASAINPIGDLYKAQVWALSEFMGVPKEVIDKKPSADLWEGQTDEQELGFSYRMADEILYYLTDERMRSEEVAALGYDENIIKSVIRRMNTAQYKRKLPVIANVSGRGMGTDFKYPRDWGV